MEDNIKLLIFRCSKTPLQTGAKQFVLATTFRELANSPLWAFDITR